MSKVITPVLFVAICLGGFLVVPAPILAAPPQAPLPIEDAMGVLSLSNRTPIALSPDGELVAYTVEDDRKRESTSDPRYMYYTRTGVFTEAVGCDIWITNTKTGKSQNLTEGKGTSWAPVWSPDGQLPCVLFGPQRSRSLVDLGEIEWTTSSTLGCDCQTLL